MLSLLIAALFLTACNFGGILVAPTAPSREPTESQSQTEARTFPSESTEVTIPETQAAVTAPPESQVPTTPATSEPQPETKPAEPTDPPATKPASGGSRHDPHQPADYSASSAEQLLLDAIRVMRSNKQLPSLAEDRTLGGLAYLRAYETAAQFGHTRPDGSGYAAVLTAYGYAVSGSGETILKCEDWYPAAYILEDWLSSGTTAAVLTDPTFTHVGVGIYEYNGAQYVVCLLAKQ